MGPAALDGTHSPTPGSAWGGAPSQGQAWHRGAPGHQNSPAACECIPEGSPVPTSCHHGVKCQCLEHRLSTGDWRGTHCRLETPNPLPTVLPPPRIHKGLQRAPATRSPQQTTPKHPRGGFTLTIPDPSTRIVSLIPPLCSPKPCWPRRGSPPYQREPGEEFPPRHRTGEALVGRQPAAGTAGLIGPP